MYWVVLFLCYPFEETVLSHAWFLELVVCNFFPCISLHSFLSSMLLSSSWRKVTHRRERSFWLMIRSLLYHGLEIMEERIFHSCCGRSLLSYYWIRRERKEHMSGQLASILTSFLSQSIWCYYFCSVLVFSRQLIHCGTTQKDT